MMTTRHAILIGKLMDGIHKIENKLHICLEKEKKYAESRAVEAIKRNPRFFYKYVREKAKIRSSIGPLKLNEELVRNTGRICEILRAQYDSVFSEPLPNDALQQGFLTGGIHTPWGYGTQFQGVWDSITLNQVFSV